VHTKTLHNRRRLNSEDYFSKNSFNISSRCNGACPMIQSRLNKVMLNTKLYIEKTNQNIMLYSNIKKTIDVHGQIITLTPNYIRSIITNSEQDNEYIFSAIMKSMENEKQLEFSVLIIDEMVFGINLNRAIIAHDSTLLEHYNVNIPKNCVLTNIYIQLAIFFMPKESHKKLLIDSVTRFQQKYVSVDFYVLLETSLKRDTEVGSFLYAKFLENLLYRCGYNHIVAYYETKEDFKYQDIVINSQYDDTEAKYIREKLIYLQVYDNFSIEYHSY
jgi:hypothetical protein